MITLATVATLAVTWFCLCLWLVAHPHLDKLQRADAVFVLGGPTVDGRWQYGRRLADEGYAPVLVISTPPPSQATSARYECGRAAHPQVLCFQPDPRTTRGEARELGRLARERGWTKIIVVTSNYHVTRARWIIGRCFDGTLLMESPKVDHSAAEMLREFGYQTGAFVKSAVVTTGC